MHPPFEGLDRRIQRWVDYEQTVNERLIDDTRYSRIAKGKVLPRFGPGRLPRRSPFSIAGNAGDHHTNFGRPRILRGFDRVERYGLWGFVWPINRSLVRFFDRYDAKRVEQQYLELWQQAAIDYLKVRPLFRRQPKGLATDEADAAEPLLGEGRTRRRSGRVYERLPSAWGDMFMLEGLPAFFRPAF